MQMATLRFVAMTRSVENLLYQTVFIFLRKYFEQSIDCDKKVRTGYFESDISGACSSWT